MRVVYLISILVAISSAAQARWLTIEEADAVIEDHHVDVEIEKNGNANLTTEIKFRIQNEKGRDAWGTMRFQYSPKNMSFDVVEAYTINDGVKTKVAAKDIVDTALHASEIGFDEKHEVVVPFSKVQVGSVLSYKIKSKIFHPFIEGRFADEYFLGDRVADKNFELNIKSARKVFWSMNDPDSALTLEKNENSESNRYQYKVHLNKPVFKQVGGEAHPYIPSSLRTWIVVSTEATYADFYRDLANRYEQLYADALPREFEATVAKAKKISSKDFTKDASKDEESDVVKFNLVLSDVSDLIRYMGDWREVDGGYVPHRVSEVVKNQYGDCKDLAMLTSRILRELGYDARVAVVYRGVNPPPLSGVPYLAFNHAIVSVKVKDRYYWLDPTNFQAFAQGVFDDLVDRDALILNPQNLEVKHIDFSDPKENVDIMQTHIRFVKDDRRLETMNYHGRGVSTVRMTGAELRFSKSQIQEETIAASTSLSDVIGYSFDDFDLKDRTVKPIHMSWKIDRNYRPMPTSMGPATSFSAPGLLDVFNNIDVAHRESHLNLVAPSINQHSVVVENVKIKGDKIKSCTVDSPWLSYSFRVKHDKQLKIDSELTIKRPYISATEMKAPLFQKFRSDLTNCDRVKYFIYEVNK